jgi:hypothetical protein
MDHQKTGLLIVVLLCSIRRALLERGMKAILKYLKEKLPTE